MKLNNQQIDAITATVYTEVKKKIKDFNEDVTNQRIKLFYTKLGLKANHLLKEFFEKSEETRNRRNGKLLSTDFSLFSFIEKKYEEDFNKIPALKPNGWSSGDHETDLYKSIRNKVVLSSIDSGEIETLITNLVKEFAV